MLSVAYLCPGNTEGWEHGLVGMILHTLLAFGQRRFPGGDVLAESATMALSFPRLLWLPYSAFILKAFSHSQKSFG